MKTTRFLSLLLIGILIATMSTPATVMAKKKEKKVSTVHTPMKVVKKHLSSLEKKGIELPWKGEFKPEKLVTVGEFAWILYKLYGDRLKEDNNSFEKILEKPKNKRYYEPIKWVLNAGVMDAGWNSETGVTRFAEKKIVDEYLFFYTTSRLARELEIQPPKVREKVFKFRTNYDFDENLVYRLIKKGDGDWFIEEAILWGIIRKPKKSDLLYLEDKLDRESLVIYLDRLTSIEGFRKEDGKIPNEGFKQEDSLNLGDGIEKMTDPTLPLNDTEEKSSLGYEMGQLIEEENEDEDVFIGEGGE